MMNSNNKNESGFALVMTMAVLMGMLIIITPLVLINNNRAIEARSLEGQTLAQMGVESGKNISTFLNRRNGVGSMPSFMKRSILPGWRSVPLRLYAESSSKIANMLPAFLMMAEPLGVTSSAITKDGAAPGGLGYHQWVVVGGELMSSSKRGIAGVQSPHAANSVAYGLSSASTPGWARVNGQWYSVGNWVLNDDMSGNFSGVTFAAGDTIEFFPARVHNNDSYGTSANLDINVTVIDERSRINLNTMPDSIIGAMGLTGITTNSIPYITVNALISENNATAAREALVQNKNFLTTFSSPDFTFKSASITSYKHPININTAPYGILAMVFKAIGVVDYNGLAQNIVNYREGPQPGDTFDGGEDPFDGVSPTYSNAKFNSPEEEFENFLNVTVGIAEAEKIMKHVYLNTDMPNYSDYSNAIPLCFEVDDVQTARISARVKSGSKPVVEKNATVTAIDLTSEYADTNGTTNEIVFDSYNGWNWANSEMVGVDWRMADVTSTGGDTAAIRFNTATAEKSATFGPGMVGIYDNEVIRLRYITDFDGSNVNFKRHSDALANASGNIDFGLRVVVNRTDLVKVAGVPLTSTAASSDFTIDGTPAAHFDTTSGQGELFFVLPGQDPQLIEYTGTANPFSANPAFTADPIGQFDAGGNVLSPPDGNLGYFMPRYGHSGISIYPSAGTGIHYKTTIYKSRVEWDTVEWWTNANGPSIKAVEINGSSVNGSSVATLYNGHIQRMSASLPALGNGTPLELKFIFDDDTDRDQQERLASCPQLFKVIVKYKAKATGSQRIILDQR